jgi:hypothetical protein
MRFDSEIIKDFIIERNTSVKRDNIIFVRIYLDDGYIIAPYRDPVWSTNFRLKLSDYEVRLKQKLREIKINDIIKNER